MRTSFFVGEEELSFKGSMGTVVLYVRGKRAISLCPKKALLI
jgi:hypothetical protein